jgi:formylglycine-generating enzyme required for sulfatase activity
MAGNVDEWCGDVYRKDANPIGGDDQNPFRGNVYQYVAMSEDGEEAAIDEATGNLIYQNVPDDMNRRNYRQADNINYLDGDWNSSIYDFESKEPTSAAGWLRETDEEDGGDEEYTRSNDEQTNQMYHRSDSLDRNNITSMINNRVRVVKGGSWRDRAYWMQSGTRRYYDQDRSTAWIGFRCAMDRMGSRTGAK